jgi:hypothetical protein
LALDRRSGQRVAVKKIADVFGDSKEAKRTLREVRLMRHFRGSSPHVRHHGCSCRVLRVVSCRVVSCCVVSCRVVLCRVVLCRVVSCRVVV